jgi:hypothetical protein
MKGEKAKVFGFGSLEMKTPENKGFYTCPGKQKIRKKRPKNGKIL